jgi:hypothetical protein
MWAEQNIRKLWVSSEGGRQDFSPSPQSFGFLPTMPIGDAVAEWIQCSIPRLHSSSSSASACRNSCYYMIIICAQPALTRSPGYGPAAYRLWIHFDCGKLFQVHARLQVKNEAKVSSRTPSLLTTVGDGFDSPQRKSYMMMRPFDYKFYNMLLVTKPSRETSRSDESIKLYETLWHVSCHQLGGICEN